MASPLENLLNRTLPTFLGQELANVRNEARFEAGQEREEKRYLQEFNRNESRYQDGLRRQTELDDRDFDSNLINQGSNITNLQNQKDYYNNLLKSGSLRSTAGFDLSESRVNALNVGIKQAGENVKMLEDIGIEKYYTDQAKNFYMQGNDAAAFNIIDNQLRNKFKDSSTIAQAQLYMSDIKSYNTQLGKLIGVNTPEVRAERERIEGLKNNATNQFRELYELAIPFDPTSIRKELRSLTRQAIVDSGVETKDLNKNILDYFGEGGKYQDMIDAFESRYVVGAGAESFSAEERRAELDKIVVKIKNIEKTSPKPPGTGDELLNDFSKLDTEGKILAGAATGYLLKEPAKKAVSYMNKKGSEAIKAVKQISGMPGKDVVKFLDLAGLDTPGKPGQMMPKVENLIDKISELTGEKKTKANKRQLAKLNSELDGQVKKVMKRMRQLKVSPGLKDADLERLIRNPNQWRLAKIKAGLMKSTKLAKPLRNWGYFSASAKLGEAIGDPTGGVATGIGLPAVAKKVSKLYKEKGSKWLLNKLTPVMKKSAAKRIVGGAATAAATANPYVIAGATLAGIGLTAVDFYNLLQSLDEEE